MSSAPAILAFDTATSNCSMAITRGDLAEGKVVGSLSFDSEVTHSRRLLGAVDWLLQTTDMEITDISALAVGVGPGSFTGLRIGMATAKGLAHGKGLPLLGISSLDAIGAGVRSERLICVVMDARKKQVYCCFYRCKPDGRIFRSSEPAVMQPEELAILIKEPVTMAGDGVRVYNALFSELLGESAEFLPWTMAPQAVNIGFLASKSLAAGDFLDIDSAVPDYVRSSDAQLSLVSPLS
jgi:tRNA threonylcarbamoyladenosine biosynthesis protein TsaB